MNNNTAKAARRQASDPTAQFAEAMAEHGLQPAHGIHAGGGFRRFSTNGNKNDKPGFYRLDIDDTNAFGCFGDWSKDLLKSWSSVNTKEMSQTERAAHDKRIKELRRQAERKRFEAYREAAKKARADLSKMADCKAHSYLTAKGVRPVPGLKLSKSGDLVTPIYGPGSDIISYQRIFETGEGFQKKFMAGGRAKGGWFKIAGSDIVCVCEGLATGLSIHEATGHTVIIAFSGSNLVNVAKQANSKNLIICADNDASRADNPGLKYAKDAANAVGASLAIPVMPSDVQGTDFNDLATVSDVSDQDN